MAVVVVLVGVAVTGLVVVRRPLPEVAGNLTVPGLESQVTVTRDDRGVPTITAQSSDDLFMAQGYVAAQDRFFEMDYRRHVTSGRLAELVGDKKDAIDADKVTRTLGLAPGRRAGVGAGRRRPPSERSRRTRTA